MTVQLIIIFALASLIIFPIAFLFWDKNKETKLLSIHAEEEKEVADYDNISTSEILSEQIEAARDYLKKREQIELKTELDISKYIYPSLRYFEVYKSWAPKEKVKLINTHDAIFQELLKDQIIRDFDSAFPTIKDIAILSLEKPRASDGYLPPYNLEDIQTLEKRIAFVFLNYANIGYKAAFKHSKRLLSKARNMEPDVTLDISNVSVNEKIAESENGD